MRFALPLLVLVCAALAAPSCDPAPDAPSVPGQEWHVGDFVIRTSPAGSVRQTRTQFEYTFHVSLENRGPAAIGVVAAVSSAAPATVVVSPPLAVGELPRDGSVTTASPLVFQQDRRLPFDPLALSWKIAAETARDSAGYEIDPPGAWYAGDLHVHATGASNDTGGNSLPDDIARIARERGLFFVTLTDHSNSTGSDPNTTAEDPALFNRGPEFPYWDKAAALSEPGKFLLIDGNELSPRDPGSLPTGHVNCIPPSLEGFDRSGAFIDRPMGSVNGAQTISQARSRGCYVILNHPYSFTPWIAFDWSSLDYDAIEVWAGGIGIGYTPADTTAHAAWRCDLLAGRRVTPIASSDVHRVFTAPPGALSAPALGWPSTSVFASQPTWPAIIEGLRAGRVTLHEGESRLFLDGYDGRLTRAEGRESRALRLRGKLDPRATAARLTVTRATACTDPRPAQTTPLLQEDTLLDVTVAPGESLDRSIAILGEPGVYTAKLIPAPAPVTQTVHHGALSRAVIIR
jgi:hypothetical protein